MTTNRLTRFIFALAVMVVAPMLWAVEVTPEQARTAARNWIGKSPTRMTAKFASSGVHDVQTSKNAAGRALYHVVSLSDGGYVVTSGDTELPPVIAFSDSGALDLDDTGNPLIALLERDMGRRIGLVDGTVATPGLKARAGGAPSEFEAEWADLTGDKGGSVKRGADGKPVASKTSLSSLSDVRVSPLVQSKWGQSTWNGYNTFNYYTPNNYVCGCVATAFAQIMRYWQQPTSSVTARSYYCKVGETSSLRTMIGGTYSWSNMPLTSSSCTSSTQREAIGKLLYDVGVASQMKWSSGGSGTMGFAGSQALKNAFGYASSQAYFDVTGWGLEVALASQTAFRDAILASLDAGMPCAVGVGGDNGGHEMVLDGYGFSGSVIYSHLNCGWSGSEDMWYNFFGEYVTSYSFSYMDELGYNIHPTVSGDVLSGRVLNSSGSAVSGATVTLSGAGTSKTTTTDAKGIYAFRITSAGSYTVSASYGSQSGLTTATVSAMSVSTSATLDSNCSYSKNASNGTLGNKWGVNVTLANSSEATLSSISINGNSSVVSGGSATYSCTATMSDGTTKTVSPTWSIYSGESYASISSSGTLTAYSTTVQRSVAILASYTLNGVTRTATKTITIIPASTGPIFTIEDGVLKAVDLNGYTSVTIPSSVTKIGDYAFEDCVGLESVSIPSSVTEIGGWAFLRCFGLTSVTIPASVRRIGSCPFLKCSNLSSIAVASGNSTFVMSNGALINNTTHTLVQYTPKKSGAYEIPSGVTSLGWAAFSDTLISSVTVPASVTYVDSWALGECCNLVSITFKGNAPDLGSYGLFEDNNSACTVYVSSGSTGWGVTIPGTWRGVPIQYSNVPVPTSTYAIKFNKYDGSGTTVTQTFDSGVKERLPSIKNGLKWVRSGFVFKGWATSMANANAGKIWKGDWAYVTSATQAGKTLNVYAVWVPASGYYAIKFNKNDGLGSWRTVAFPYGTSKALPSCVNGLGWKRDGFAFVGWAISTSKAANPKAGNIWKVDQEAISTAVQVGETLNVYAAWVKGYTIRFHRNDGTNATKAQGFVYGTEERLPAIKNGLNWDWSGYVFKGWATSKANATAGKVWKKDWAVVKTAAAVGATLNVYAIWGRGATGPANDNFANATAISGSSGSVSGSNVGATAQSGEPLLQTYSYAINTVWWAWTAPASGTVAFSTAGTGFDTVMGIYTGSSVTGLTTIKEDDDGAGGGMSSCTFTAKAGTTYRIVVAGYNSDYQGTIKLNWKMSGASNAAVGVKCIGSDKVNGLLSAGFYTGILADGTGTYALLLDGMVADGVMTGYLCVSGEEVAFAAECEAVAAAEGLHIQLENGQIVSIAPDGRATVR